MAHGAADAFVFMMDMNQLFEYYAARITKSYFGTPVQTQKYFGMLFTAPQCLSQYPHYLWDADREHWIGDAK